MFLASTRSCSQFQWNRKYFFSLVRRLRGRLLMAPWHGFHLLDRERWIRLTPPRVRRTSPSLPNFSSISATICLLPKIFCKDNKFFYLKNTSSFPTFLLKYFRISVTVPNAICISLPSKVFYKGNLEENFINFVTFCLYGLVCWRLIVSK